MNTFITVLAVLLIFTFEFIISWFEEQDQKKQQKLEKMRSYHRRPEQSNSPGDRAGPSPRR